MKVKRRFMFEGIEMLIVDREESYMNSAEKVTVRRVIAPNGKSLPISIKHKQTLKSIVLESIEIMNGFKKNGCRYTKRIIAIRII